MPNPSILIISLIIGMGLKIAPFPALFSAFNPDWALLVVLSFCLTIPERFSIGSAWLVGLLNDVLTAKLLGQFALAYAICAYIVVGMHRQIRHFPLLQQCVLVFLLLTLSRITIYITSNIEGIPRADWSYWTPTLVGACLWPLIHRLVNPK